MQYRFKVQTSVLGDGDPKQTKVYKSGDIIDAHPVPTLVPCGTDCEVSWNIAGVNYMTNLSNLEPLNANLKTMPSGQILQRQLFAFKYVSPFVMAGVTYLVAKKITKNNTVIILSCVSVAIIDFLVQGIPNAIVNQVNKKTNNNHPKM